jgi:hypothetical protein
MESFYNVSARLNLASQPFRNRALPWTITAIIMVASLIALVFIISKSSQTSAQAKVVDRDLQSLREQAEALKQEATKISDALTPEQRRTLDAAHLLVDRKRFSWSLLFSDLETAMPNNVRVARINVRDVVVHSGQTMADLELTVVGKDPNDVTGMIRDMGRSGIFQAELLGQNLQKGKGEGGTEWTLRVRYTPRAGAPAAPKSSNTTTPTKAASNSANEGVAQ